jgi:hypothetical protein
MRLTKKTTVVRAVWMDLPELARWVLLGLGRRPGTVTTGDLRRVRAGCS